MWHVGRERQSMGMTFAGVFGVETGVAAGGIHSR